MKNIVVQSDYTFVAASKTITFDATYTGIEQKNIMLITHLSDGVIIYQFNKGGTKGGSLVGLVLTLEYNTTTYNDADELLIIIESDLFGGAGLTDAELRATAVPVSLSNNALETGGNIAAILAKIIAAPATAANQSTIITALSSLLTELQLKADLTDTQLVSAASLPLPSGAATSALQTTGNTSLASIITALGTLLTDAQLRASAVPVTGTVAITGAGDASAANQTTEIARLTSILAALVGTLVVSGTVTSNAGTNLNTSALALEATLQTILTQSDFDTKIGNLTETAPANDTASSGLNGRLQRIAQRITSLIALIPSALGSNTKSNSLSVALASDMKYQPVYGTTTSMTVTNLNSLANSATVGWQSAKISNLSTLATDYEIMIKLTMANTAPANDKAVYVYVCPFYTDDAGTTWYASSQGTTTLPTGTEGASTIASPNNLRLLGVLNYTTQNMVLQDSFFLSNAFGNRMPDAFSIIVINFSGAAIAASTNLVKYSPINEAIK
jgi:hypothetical protein